MVSVYRTSGETTPDKEESEQELEERYEQQLSHMKSYWGASAMSGFQTGSYCAYPHHTKLAMDFMGLSYLSDRLTQLRQKRLDKKLDAIEKKLDRLLQLQPSPYDEPPARSEQVLR